jgi:hypothetical protein
MSSMMRSGLSKKMSSIATPARNLKVLCVLYPDPVTGYPKSFPRNEIPKITSYPNGQTLPAPKGIDFVPGTLLGSVSGELGLRKYIGKIKVLIDSIRFRKKLLMAESSMYACALPIIISDRII